METWKDIPDYEGIYEVSNTGKVRTAIGKKTYSERHGERTWVQRELKQKVSKDGNHRIELYKDKKHKTWLVHRLVAIAFHPLVQGKDYVNHIDGNRRNNAAENLEWCNHKENNNHAFDTRLIKTGIQISLVHVETREEFSFRSMAKASHFLGKNDGYVSALLMKGVNFYRKYEIKKGELK